MQNSKIYFYEFIGIIPSDKPEYMLKNNGNPEFQDQNNSIHPGVLVTLTEATAREYLQITFPEYTNNLNPILQKLTVQFKRAVKSTIYSKADVSKEKKEKLLFELDEKGRSTIEVNVELFDAEHFRIMSAVLEWYIILENK
ncbi:MAG: hypothetical protein JW904_12005 [Spirochaetales bacterium]|nr:hypothetical protein [Spirochaetales bacterium]